jgi:hypothetical protein
MALDLTPARAHPDRLGKTKEEAMPRFSYALMATLMAPLATATAVPAAAQPAPGQPPAQKICLNNQDVQSASSNDGKTMVFRMRNGTTYINHLRGSCPGLRFNGFAWELRGIADICENQQTLRVLRSGEVCMLGKFDAPLPKGAKVPTSSQ